MFEFASQNNYKIIQFILDISRKMQRLEFQDSLKKKERSFFISLEFGYNVELQNYRKYKKKNVLILLLLQVLYWSELIVASFESCSTPGLLSHLLLCHFSHRYMKQGKANTISKHKHKQI